MDVCQSAAIQLKNTISYNWKFLDQAHVEKLRQKKGDNFNGVVIAEQDKAFVRKNLL